MTHEAILMVTRDRYETPEFKSFRKGKYTVWGQASMANGSNYRHGGGRGGGSGRSRSGNKGRSGGRGGGEITVVAVTRVGAAAQWAEEPQAHAENLATSATAASIFGVSAQNCCVSTTKKRDMNTLPDLAHQCRTQELNSERSWFTLPVHKRPRIRGKESRFSEQNPSLYITKRTPRLKARLFLPRKNSILVR